MATAVQATHSDTAPRWAVRLGTALAALLALRLGFLLFNNTDLMFDEAQYWAWAQEPAFGYFSKPPLIAWLIALTTSVCGDGEACVRLSSPLLYTAAAVFIFLAGAKLYDERTGFWSALLFATLPGISLSSGIVSTDVPLLTCWSAALCAWVGLRETRAWRWSIALGLAIGLGLLAKYAMAYFYLCVLIWLAFDKQDRWVLRDLRGAVAFVVMPLLAIAPNIVWNIGNAFATFSHTAANANWQGSFVHPINALEFFGAQFGVFGPIAFAFLLWIAYSKWRRQGERNDRMLLAFALPIIAIIVMQAFLARAHANWAATAYPAASILVAAFMLRRSLRGWMTATLALNVLVLLLTGAGAVAAPILKLPGNPYARVLGWQDTADAVRQRLAGRNFGAIVSDERVVTAELLYYLRDASVPVLAWKPQPTPRDHFELTRPFVRAGEPALLVTLHADPQHVTSRFASSQSLGAASVATGAARNRTLYFFALEGFKDKSDAR